MLLSCYEMREREARLDGINIFTRYFLVVLTPVLFAIPVLN